MLQLIVLLLAMFAPKAAACGCDCPPNPFCPDEPCCTAEK
jgi:hypothetical protein